MKDDTISRQAVLKLLAAMPPEEAMTKAMLIQSVQQLESVQPVIIKTTNLQQTCNKVATDTISRQEAIDYFVTNVGFHDEDGVPIEDSDELRKIWTEYFDGIPSVQPDEEKISDTLYNIYRNTSPHTSAEGVAANRYYIREIYREIYGEEGPRWMKK